MKQKMVTPSFLTPTYISFLKNWQFQLLEFSHVHWRCSIVLAYISHHLQKKKDLVWNIWHDQCMQRHCRKEKHHQTFTTTKTWMPYMHRTDNTLNLLKKTVIQKSNPKTRTLCFWKISSTGGRVSNWNRDARLENQGSVGRGGTEKDRTSNLAEPKPAFTIQPWIWFPPKILLNHGALSHGINYASHSHQHYHCKNYI